MRSRNRSALPRPVLSATTSVAWLPTPMPHSSPLKSTSSPLWTLLAGWELAYNNDNLWHFRFHGPTPEALVKGREKIYFAYFWNDLAADKRRSLSTADRNAYVAAYSRPGRMRAGWAYFAAWPDTAKDFAEMAKTKLTMPVLSLAGEKASAAILGSQMKLVATAVTEINLKDTGHWLMEELPEETMKALIAFL